MSRGREFARKAALGVWFVFVFAACSEKARDVGGESHFVCESDDDCDVDSVCVRDGSSRRGECRPIRGVGGSSGTGGEAPQTGGAGTGAPNDASGGRSNGGGAPGASSGGSSGTRASTTGGVGGGGDSGSVDSGTGNDVVRSTGGRGADAGACEACARGAVSLKVSSTPGRICSHTVGQISIPQNTAGVLEALNCDFTKGCHPDAYVVVDHDPGTTVACSVRPNGGSFNVSVSLAFNGAATDELSLQFQATGVLSPTGGTLIAIAESNSVAQGAGGDNACTVTVDATHGRLEAGKIWASVHCGNFRDPTDISETGCTLDGVFLFENCSS